ASSVLAIDLDEVAVKVADINVKLNKCQEAVKVQQSNLMDKVDMQPDLVVANILADVIVLMTDDAFAALRPGGTFITS
ncbi:50S ribosomal protein L11 methyltransferase, partial [Pseudomonas sp. 2822-15]|uniref:50S ribosomal protein L11 methyltransferase n=1 Tax=Pseudomonas sp. 2822-15 TaxID=1712677 RepID=UPI0015B17386